jgi:nucleoside phosphorylase
MSKIVIQTALVLEQNAVISKLSNISDYEHPESKTQYKFGEFTSSGDNLQIAVGRTNQTNVEAGIETERIIRYFNPDYIFFVGVAGGLKDVKIGDIVIGTEVYGYEKAKVGKDYLSRPQFAFSSYALERKAVDFAQTETWKAKSELLVNSNFHNDIFVHSGTIASGEKVISSKSSNIYEFLKINCSHALAVDMEGLGFLEACRPYPLIKTLLIRGISDLIENKEFSDVEGSQQYASKNASEFLFGLIDYLNIKQKTLVLSIKDKLFEIAPKLYPEGLKDKSIWRRAGGDLSLVQLDSIGKAQWIEALTLIENGGGGEIDFNSLIKVMKSDYPKNESLNALS